MAWNEPGGGNKDPWGGSGNDGPPDLDELARKMRDRMNRFLVARVARVAVAAQPDRASPSASV